MSSVYIIARILAFFKLNELEALLYLQSQQKNLMAKNKTTETAKL